MAKKAAQLHELLAVEADLKNTSEKIVTEGMNTFTKRADHFMGQTRSVNFLDEARAGENLTEEKPLNDTIDAKLMYVLGHAGRYFDALYQKEEANQRAVADLELDGEVLLSNVPATFLLGMESRLKGIRNVVASIPTLDPSLQWKIAKDKGDGIFVSNEISNFKTEKTLKSKIMYEATKEHPAQIEKWSEDVPVARISTTKTSAMWTPAQKAAALGRVDSLLRAVKKARQRANCVDVRTLKFSDVMKAVLTGK